MKTVCIYHANCFDGICAAWVVSKKYPNAEFIPANYGNEQLIQNIQQDCYENANINDSYIIVDFSFPRDLMQQMYNKAVDMIVLDHHKTAEENCRGLNFCKFDMNESGASLTWKHFFPHKEVPWLVAYIADRDLWKFNLPDSEDINAYIQSFPMTIEQYEILSNSHYQDARMQGNAINRYKQQMTQAICKTARVLNVAGYDVPVANAPILMSEVGHELCKQYPNAAFAAYNFKRSDGVTQWGARSIGDFDVSTIAKSFGGGGHKNAAGWQESV